MKGLGQTPRQKSRQDACSTEEKARQRGKWHRHSCLCAVDEAWDSEPGKPRGIARPRFFIALSPSSKTSKFDAEV